MVSFAVLGTLRVVQSDGTEIPISGARQRRLLSALLLHRNGVVSVDRLTALVWDADSAVDTAALQSLVFRLRTRVRGLDLAHRPPGYVLRVSDDSLDVATFERLVLAAIATLEDDPDTAQASLHDALALWHGVPYEELEGDDARIETARLTELRARAVEELLALRLDRGAAADVVPELEAFVLSEPLRERPRHLLMRAYAEAGRRADALRVYDGYRRVLAGELGVDPSPELRRRHDELLTTHGTPSAIERPSAARTTAFRRSLRRPTSSFVGRELLVREVQQKLGSARLVTLLGPGGVGKTRVATEVAHRLAESGRDAIFCDLTAATADTVVDIVNAAVRVESRAGQGDIERLVEVLRHERCCVVLDNCEHVLEQAAHVAERLTDSTDHVVVLATSRERIAVDGEHLVVVPTLTHDGGTASPATALLVDRMAAVTGRAPDDAELAQLDELARRLDGLPLALELAAARLQSLSVRDVLEGVESSVALLTGGRRTIERHRSVEAALRWSYDVLDDGPRAALRAAATFASPFRTTDIAALLSSGRDAAIERVAELVERSLAVRDGDRIRLLHVVRTFALEQTPSDERDRLDRAFAHRMRDVAVALRADLRTASDSAPIDEYLIRIADFRRAIDLALREQDADVALGIVMALRDLAFNSTSFELQRWGEDAASAGERLGHPDAVDAYAVAGLAAWKRGSLHDTRRLLARAEALVARDGSSPTYELLGTQATENLAHGALDRAIERLALAEHAPGTRDDAIRLAETLGTSVICRAYAHRGDARATADALLAAVDSGTSAPIARAWCHYASGECRLDTEPDAARHHLELAVRHARTGGSTFIEGIAGASLASLDVRSGDVAGAVGTYRWLVPLWLRAGLQSPFWTGMRSVAELLWRAGETSAAARVLGAVMAPGAGHDVYGADAARLAELGSQLREHLGAAAYDAAVHTGSRMDEAAVAHEATAAFDRISVRRV